MSTTFADLGVPHDLVRALGARGIDVPFEVQAATIPDALAGRDVSGRAPTGSGKTLAFGVPLLARTGKAKPGRPRALVLAPTRELAAQITKELVPLAHAVGRRVFAVYGGVGYDPQRRALRRGVDVLVACPGRLADLVEQGDVDLGSIEAVVIDEADRMADMGFLPQVRKLLDRTPEERQTMLFSATLDGDVGALSREYQRDAVRHDAGAPEPDGRAAQHLLWRVEPGDRAALMADLAAVAGPTIVFTRTRHGADRLAKQLDRAGVRAAAIHGGRSQNQRDRALAAFTSGPVQVLVATDVAARGIHVDGVACVVHFDKPEDEKAYLHRSGRTARAGAGGTVVSFVPRHEVKAFAHLRRVLDLDVQMTAPDLGAVAPAAPARPGPAPAHPVPAAHPHDGRGRHAAPKDPARRAGRNRTPAHKRRGRGSAGSGSGGRGSSGSGSGGRGSSGSGSGGRGSTGSGSGGRGRGA